MITVDLTRNVKQQELFNQTMYSIASRVRQKPVQLDLFGSGDFYYHEGRSYIVTGNFSSVAMYVHPLNAHKEPFRGGFRL